MALVTLNLSMVRSHGDADTPYSDDGFVTLTPLAHGVYEQSLRSPEPVELRITNGIMPEVEVAPGYWRVKVEPMYARSWTPFVVEIVEGMMEPVNLATLAPDVEIQGIQYARGERGYSNYELAVQNGFEGTVEGAETVEFIVSVVTEPGYFIDWSNGDTRQFTYTMELV